MSHSRFPPDYFRCGKTGIKAKLSLAIGVPDLSHRGYVSGWRCDSCNKSYPVNVERWYNALCTTDYCFACKPRLWYCCKQFTPRAGPGYEHHPVATAIVPGMPVFESRLLKFGGTMRFDQMDSWVCVQNGVPHNGNKPAVLGWVPLLEGFEPVLSSVEPTYRVPSFRGPNSPSRPTTPFFHESETGIPLPIVLSRTQKTLRQTAVMRSLQKTVVGTGYNAYGVSWDDASRGVVDGCLNAYGANITDTTLCTKSGDKLYMIRPENFDERLGMIRAKDLRLLVGNHVPHSRDEDLRSTSLDEYLSCIGIFGEYVGLDTSKNLSAEHLDDYVSVRFQTVFIPLSKVDSEGPVEVFCAQSYSYNTHDADNPKNIMLICSSQGTAVMQNLPGKQRLQHHVVKIGDVQNAWLEARPTKFKVAEAQVETAVERAAAAAAGKACARALGFKAMGLGMNTVMTIQIPLVQKTVARVYNSWTNVSKGGGGGFSVAEYALCNEVGGLESEEGCGGKLLRACAASSSSSASSSSASSSSSAYMGQPRGRSSVARVSLGSTSGKASLLVQKNPQRHKHEHITVTIIRYHVVQDGVPTAEDVKRATQEMDRFYEVLDAGNLADIAFDFVKSDMSASEVAAVAQQAPVKSKAATPRIVACKKKARKAGAFDFE
jgi:hypothetical protein